MSPEDTFGFAGLAAQILLGILFVVAFIGLRIYFFWRRVLRNRGEIKRHKDAGTIAPPSFFDGQTLPAQYDAIARIGSGGAAPISIDERILRSAIGVRLFVFGLFAVITVFVLWPEIAPEGFHEAILELPIPPIATQIFIWAAGLNGVFYIFGFEARYNRDVLIVTRMFLMRREYRWKDLLWIKDDGAYDLVLTFAKGGKAKVLKHSIGIEEFKIFAMDQIQRNRLEDARAARG